MITVNLVYSFNKVLFFVALLTLYNVYTCTCIYMYICTSTCFHAYDILKLCNINYVASLFVYLLFVSGHTHTHTHTHTYTRHTYNDEFSIFHYTISHWYINLYNICIA